VTGHVFIDESKARGYLLAAAALLPADLGHARLVIRGLTLPGQQRLHMTKESDPRRRSILSALRGLDLTVTLYDAGCTHIHELDARAGCLRQLVTDAAAAHATLLVLEEDASLRRWDNQQLIEITRDFGCHQTLRYEHRRAAVEPLLAVPDAIAWCWARGGDWRNRVRPLIDTVHRVDPSPGSAKPGSPTVRKAAGPTS